MGFEHCHPAVNLIFFTAVLYGTLTFRHPVFLAISFVCAFAYSVKRNGVRAVVFNTLLLPLIIAFALYYSSYTHFGVTVLDQNFIGNNVTLESLVYGMVLGFTAAAVMIWFSCIYSVFSSDKAVYLFGRISPRLSLFLSILLRLIPRIKKEAVKINTAQKGIGRGIGQGNILVRIRNCVRVLSILITWTIDSLVTASASMQSRGSNLRGRRSFSIYRFDFRDRAYAVFMFFFMTLTAMGVMLGQTDTVYDPRIIVVPLTLGSYVFYIGYCVLCIMPLCLELWTDHRFYISRKRAHYLEKSDIL